MHYENQNEFNTHFIKSSISSLGKLIWPGKYMTKSTGKKRHEFKANLRSLKKVTPRH